MLDVRNLSIHFGDFIAVNDISFQVKKGEIFGLLGANGAGKTTTIRALCGLISPTTGEIQVNDTIYDSNHPTSDGLKSRIGYMTQRFTLYDDLTVEENWEFAAALRRLDKKKYQQRRDELTQWLSLGNHRKTLVGNLVSGLKQQVALAAALFHNPDLIFLDEPTAGVSPYSRFQFWQLIRSLAQDGRTIIVTTHYMDEAENCDRLALMRGGKIIALDPPFILKNKIFPNGIYKILASQITSELKELLLKAKEDGLLNVWAHGNSHHVVAYNDGHLLSSILAPHQDQFTLIQPSLEDVFLELVEGRDR